MKKYKNDKISIKNLDYSSPDCQLLIREYTKLICKLTKKYDKAVSENEALHRRIENMHNSNKFVTKMDIPSECINVQKSFIAKLLYLLKKVFVSFKRYGFKLTMKKIFKNIRYR